MKKRTKRLLATLLASVMILQQGSTVGVLATEETGDLPAETVVAETQAPILETQASEIQAAPMETQAPETKAPETKAPETQAPETKAPEAKAPETQAPGTKAPETKAPEIQATESVTEAQTSAPETVGTTENVTETQTEAESQTASEPETAGIQTGTEETAGTADTPAAPETETTTEAVTEAISEFAIETEAPKTDFIYEDARVKITATAQPEAKLPQDAQIHADYMQPGTPEYQAAAAALEAVYAGQDVVLDYVFYDIYFTAASVGDGRIEPEAGTVAVSMQFKQPELTPETEAAQAADETVAAAATYDVMHVEDGKAQEVKSNVQTTGDGSVVSVGFTSDSFSPYAIVSSRPAVVKKMSMKRETSPIAAGNPFADLSDAKNITESNASTQTSITTEGQGVTNLAKGSSYHFDLHVTFPRVDPTQVYYVDLSSLHEYLELDTSSIPTDRNAPGVIDGLGHYYLDVNSNRLYFVFDNTDSAARNVNTHIFLEASASRSDMAEGSDVKFKIGDEEFEFKWYDERSQLEIEKDDNSTYTESGNTITFTVKVTSKTGSNIVRSLSDSFKLLSVAKDFDVTVTKQPDAVPVEAKTVVTGTNFTTTLTPEYELKEGEFLTFTYTMNIDKTKAVDGVNVIENTAQVIFKDNWEQERQSDQASWTKKIEVNRPSVKKEKISETPESEITWRVTVEKGEQGLDKDKVILEDSWDFAGLVFTEEELKTAKVTITYGEGNSKEVTGDAILSAVKFDGQDFKIDFEKLASILEITDIDRFVLEYTAKVKVKEEGEGYLAPGQTKDVTNTVTVEKDGTTTGSSSAQGTIENNTELGITAQKSHTSITDTDKTGIKKVEWTSQLTIKEGFYSKLYLEDKLTLDPPNVGGTIWGWYDVTGVAEDGSSNASHNSIIESIEFLPKTAEEAYFKNMKIERGSSYEWNKDPHEQRWIGFILTLLDSPESPVKVGEDVTITLKYVSYYDYDTVKDAGQNNGKITNNIKFYNGESNVVASDEISEGFLKGAITKATYGAVVNEEGKVGWQVVVKADVLNSLYYSDAAKKWRWPDSAYFIDTLPENMKLMQFYTDKEPNNGLVGYNHEGNTYGSTPIEDGYIRVSGRILRVDILEALKKYYGTEKATKDIYFVYQTEIADLEKYVKEGAKDYKNEVTLHLGDRLPDKAEASVELKPGVNITKTAGEISDGKVSFTIGSFGKLVNAIRKTHSDKFSEVKLVDEYGYALRYDVDEFNAALDGQSIEKDTGDLYYSVDETRHIIEFYIPLDKIKDSSVLTYTLKVMPTADGSGGTNTVWLYGYEKSSSEAKVSTSASSAFGSFDSTYLSISKTGEYEDTDGEKQTEPLPEVEFELHKASYVGGSGLSYEPNVLDSVTTLADGKASFETMIEANQLYAILETKTPEGYQAITPLYVLCYYNDPANNPPSEEQLAVYRAMGVQIYNILSGGITAFTVDIVNSTGIADARLALSGTKTLDEKTPEKAGQFEFTVTDVTEYGIADAPEKEAAIPAGPFKDGEGGKINISGIRLSAAGEYTFKVSEKIESGTGIEYDPTVYKVKVTISEREDHTAYEIKKVLINGVETSVGIDKAYPLTTDKASFANKTEHYDDAMLNLSGTKTLDGAAPTEPGSFTFQIADITKYGTVGAPSKSAELPENASEIHDGENGAINITGIKFKSSGTYTFEVSEVDGKDPTIIYDKDKYTVVVTITVNSEGTAFEIENVLINSAAKTAVGSAYPLTESGMATFENTTKTYVDAELSLSGIKTLDGKPATETYVFTITDTTSYKSADEHATLPKDPITNDATGAIRISGIKFTAAGTYTFKIAEKAGDDKTIVYDTEEYTVAVKVGKNTESQLEVQEVKVNGKGVAKAEDGSYPLSTGATFENNTTSVKVSKVDVADGKELEGAHIQILDEKGNLVKEWVSGKTPHEVTGLKTGETYTLRETVAPDGYAVTTDTKFTLKADGTVDTGKTTTHAKDGVLLVEDRMTSVKISKVDVADGEELAGATIQILDEEGNVVEEWTSTTEPHEVKGLKTGKKYTLREKVAPNGYTVTTDTTFFLKADGTVDAGRTTTHAKDGVLLVEDSLNAISVRKVDETGAPLSGARLVIKNADGVALESWTTDGAPHRVNGIAKGKYTLSEIEAPEGYQVSADVPFEVTGTEKAGAVIDLSMTDRKTPSSNLYSLTVTKHLRLDGISSDIGVHEAVYYVALFADEARTQRVSSVKQIVFKNSTTSSVLFNNLGLGTYYVGETDENGTKLVSKKVNDRLIFYPEYGTTSAFTFEGSKTDGIAEFTNVYVELPAGFYLSGRLTVTKKLLVGGVEAASDDTYYARVFSDKALTKPACDVLALPLGGNSSASVLVTDLPIGETLDSSATYYVAETDVNGTPLDPAAVTEYEITVDKSEVVLSNSNWNQEVVITNDFASEEEEYESEFESETETEVDGTKTAPKTGDDTDYMRYLLLMALSAGTCAVAFGQKRRKKRVRR